MTSDASHIYTKTGDDGTTGRLFGGRVGKDDILIEACGDIDETVAALGTARAALTGQADTASSPATDVTSPDSPTADTASQELASVILDAQRRLFVVGADLMANPHARDRLTPGISRVEPADVAAIESTIDSLVERYPLVPVFIVPGANAASAALDLARAVVRRAERHTIAAARAGHVVSDPVLLVLNRMSDLLYVAARAAAGGGEAPSHE